MKDDELIKDILDFWFGDIANVELLPEVRSQLWFGGSQEVDEEITDLFEETLELAIADKLDHWAETPRGRLALIILLDQFSRNIFRGSKRAFEQDAKALSLCLEGIEMGYDHSLMLIERVFFYLPLEHSEDIEIQQTSLTAFQSLVLISMPETKEIYDSFLQYAIEHYETIKRFGRFPYRNKVLGRESSQEEIDYLIKREQR